MNNYFSHDSNARFDQRIIHLRMKHGAAGYGIYFMLLEKMRDSKDYLLERDYEVIAFELHEDAERVRSVVEDFNLFLYTDDGACFFSESFQRRMRIKDDLGEKRASAGRKGSASRWSKVTENVAQAAAARPQATSPSEETGHDDGEEHDGNTPADGVSDDKPMAKEKQTLPVATERKEKERKENISLSVESEASQGGGEKELDFDFSKFKRVFNEHVQSYHSKISTVMVMTPQRQRNLLALLKAGYTKEQLLAVVRMATGSPQLNGRTKKSFVPDFDWLFEEKNFVRILEGNFNK